MDEQQKHSEGIPFQSQGQLFALRIHGYWEKFENIVLFPFRRLASYFGQTQVFEERAVQLKVVK